MTAPTEPQLLAQQVLDHIRMNPRQHSQVTWVNPSHCGTTRCVAGWAVFLTTGSDLVDFRGIDFVVPRGLAYRETGARLLGLNRLDAGKLFFDVNDAEAVHALEFLAKGDPIDWQQVAPRLSEESQIDGVTHIVGTRPGAIV